jgi:signal transduction histidine kinase
VSRDILARVPLFAGLSAEDLAWLDRNSALVRLSAGEELFEEGSEAGAAYVLMEGELEITKRSGGRPVLLSVRREPGDIVGEMALLEQAPRMASVRARAPTTLLAIPQDRFEDLLAASPSAARAVFRTVISRWRDTQGTLRHSEKMAQLGTLTAGVAHELNNPAAAVLRSAGQLREALRALQSLPGAGPPGLPAEAARGLREEAEERAAKPPVMDSMRRADLEEELSAWLAARGQAGRARLAPVLAGLGYGPARLAELDALVPRGSLGPVLDWLAAACTAASLLREIGEGAARISGIVKGLRSYAFLDQAPLTVVDLHEGLENTLRILAHKLPPAIEVRREYAAELPPVEAYGGELNQVWTNLIDNAADALGGRGRITLRTRQEGDRAVVEVEDDGPGIPPEIRDRVFDAFFTTKPPGQGTGLGLGISYGIVANRHGGEMSLSSEPGRTLFTVRIPLVQLRFPESSPPPPTR